MVITNDHLKAAAALIDDGRGIEQIMAFDALVPCVDNDFLNTAMLMMSRYKKPEQMDQQLAEEMFAQMRVICWILMPLKIAFGTLPRLTGGELADSLANEPRTDYDAYFLSLADFNPKWGEIVNRCLGMLKMSSSRIIVCRITRLFLDRLPEPLEVASYSNSVR